MKRYLIGAAFFVAWAVGSAVTADAQQRTVVEQFATRSTAPIRVQLAAVPRGSLVTMLLRDVMRVPYVIAPEVLQDRAPVSVDLSIPRNAIPERVVTFLRRSGYSVSLVGGTVYVGKGGSPSRFTGSATPAVGYALQNPEALGIPSGSPVDLGRRDMPVAVADRYSSLTTEYAQNPGSTAPIGPKISENAAYLSMAAYIPAHRDPAYFSSVIGPLLPSITFGARSDPKAAPAEGNIASELGPDVLVMAGTSADLERAARLVQALDRPRPMVAVKAVVMQVSDVRSRGSALSVFAKIAGGKLQAGSFPADVAGAQFVRIGTASLNAMLSAVREDSRVKVVATPNLAALSGGVASMNSGAQVPTVGAVAVTDGGAPVQSVVYRDSGITLQVRPVVRGDLIEMEVRQERSTFARTTTGVEDSPTLQKSAASAAVVLKSGESVVLAGLTETSDGNTREGLLGGLLGVRTREVSNSELLVVLQAEIVPSPPTPPGQFLDLTPTEGKKDATDALAPAP